MSKQITLFNFFSKSPVVQKKLQHDDATTPPKSPASESKQKKSAAKTPKTLSNKENIKNGSASTKGKKSRKRIIVDEGKNFKCLQ